MPRRYRRRQSQKPYVVRCGVLPDIGHLIVMEAADAVNDRMSRFFNC
jgi:pimeloyl-ACP methyl ester carboxylesterase